MSVEDIEQRILVSSSKVVSKDAAQTVINGYKSRVMELERQIHQLRELRLYEPYGTSKRIEPKTEWNMLQQRQFM